MASSRPIPPNPRGSDRRGASRLTSRPSSPLWYGLAVLLVLGIAQAYFMTPPGRSLPYSEFKQLVRNGEVAEISIGDQSIRGTLKAGDAKTKAFTVTRVDDPKLTEELEARNVKYTGEAMNRWLPELLGWVIPLLFLVGIWGFFFRRMSGAEGGVMSFARSKAKIYADDEVKVRFQDVAGVEEAKDELKEIVEFLQNPKKYTNLGGRIPKGVLLVGPPGTGKTLLARAVAGEAHVPFFSLSGSEFVEMFVGVGAARIRDLFQQAEAKAPCIVFIDELDALGKARTQSPFGSHEEREQTLNQLLAEMDGFDSRKGVIIMGATNRPEVLDPALLRPGRFDRQVLVDKPDVKGREAILRIHVKGVKVGPDVDLKVIAQRTAGFAGADLANLVNEAALLAARFDKPFVDRLDFESAIDRLIAGLEKKRVMSDKERRIVAYHESGHAIVASVLPGLDPVHKIRTCSAASGARGTRCSCRSRSLSHDARRSHSQLAVLLGRRTAEELRSGDLDRRAERSQRATDMARDDHRVGMSAEMGAINYDVNKRGRFLTSACRPSADSTARRRRRKSQRIQRILNDTPTPRGASGWLRQKLESVTHRLLEIEVMEGDELRQLLT
jgi:cell division protease FtsH